MAEIIKGSGKAPEPQRPNERYGGSRYREHRGHHEPLETGGSRLVARKAALEGGHHSKWRESLGDLVEYHGDRIGLINIARLIPSFKRHKRKKRKHK